MKLDIKRILVPLDFSANSTRTDYAHGLALEFDAALHLILGVSQTCPVLTVREPKAREAIPVKTPKYARLVASVLAAGVLLAPGWATTANAQDYQQSTPGSEVYRTYCASCHGASARGDGPLASSMRKKPANLAEMAKRNGGQFPSDLVFRTIDGRQPVRGHGGPDMPVWGDAFLKSREAGGADRVKSVIQSLVDYLESIQLRPTD